MTVSTMSRAALCLTLLSALPFSAQTAGTHGSHRKTASRPMNPRSVHDSVLVVDTHADTPQRLLDQNYDLSQPLDGGSLNFEAARKGNLGAEFFSIWVEPKYYKGRYARRALDLIDSVYEQAARHPDEMTMAYSAADIVRARGQKKLAALMGLEGGHAIENDMRLLRDYYRLGVRYMTLTWSNSNEWADSSGDIDDPNVEHHQGLTEFGKDVVYEMNRLGMMVDVSHVSDKTFYKALLISRAPVIASHSSARALTNHPRNMSDDMLRALARNDGVVMVNFFSAFVDETYRKAWEAQGPERDKAVADEAARLKAEGRPMTYADEERITKEWAAKIPRPPLASLIDHIDHVAKVAGVDHVGLGSDFDGVSSLPEGIDSAADLPKITEALMRRGYTAEDMRKILGGNLLRVFRDVERVSRELHATERPRIEAAQTSGK